MANKRRRRRRKRSSHLGRNLLFVFILFSAIAATVKIALQPPEQKVDEPSVALPVDNPNLSQEEAEALRSHYERKPSFYTILVSGVDDGNGGSDTNILLAVDAANDYIYGGMKLLSETISHQLGIPVDYTVLVDLRGFEALVDAIGGVDFYIPVNMNYDDPYQNLSIHFSKGMRHLNGAEALKVVRFRHNNDGTGYGSEDIGRMQTQQDFLKAVAKQTLTPGNLLKIDSFVKIFQKYVETDLSLGNLAWLGAEAVGMGAEAVDFSTLPGDWKSPYIYLDQTAVLELVNQYLNPYVEDRLPEDLNIMS